MEDGDTYVERQTIKQAALQHVTMSHRDAEAAAANRLDCIQAARSFGASWTEVGAVMGVSRQAAHKRFARDVGESGRADDTDDEWPPLFEHVSMARVPTFDTDVHVAYHVRWRAYERVGGLEIISLARRAALPGQLAIAADV